VGRVKQNYYVLNLVGNSTTLNLSVFRWIKYITDVFCGKVGRWDGVFYFIFFIDNKKYIKLEVQ